jgi:hypothetical protein
MGGLKLNLRKDYLRFDDHALEEKILDKKMKFLRKAVSSNNCAMPLAIISGTMTAHPKYVPTDLFETFRDLLEWNSHLNPKTD